MSDRARQTCDLVASWAGSLATVTLTQVSTIAAALAGFATFGFTVHRWIYWHRQHRDD